MSLFKSFVERTMALFEAKGSGGGTGAQVRGASFNSFVDSTLSKGDIEVQEMTDKLLGYGNTEVNRWDIDPEGRQEGVSFTGRGVVDTSNIGIIGDDKIQETAEAFGNVIKKNLGDVSVKQSNKSIVVTHKTTIKKKELMQSLRTKNFAKATKKKTKGSSQKDSFGIGGRILGLALDKDEEGYEVSDVVNANVTLSVYSLLLECSKQFGFYSLSTAEYKQYMTKVAQSKDSVERETNVAKLIQRIRDRRSQILHKMHLFKRIVELNPSYTDAVEGIKQIASAHPEAFGSEYLNDLSARAAFIQTAQNAWTELGNSPTEFNAATFESLLDSISQATNELSANPDADGLAMLSELNKLKTQYEQTLSAISGHISPERKKEMDDKLEVLTKELISKYAKASDKDITDAHKELRDKIVKQLQTKSTATQTTTPSAEVISNTIMPIYKAAFGRMSKIRNYVEQHNHYTSDTSKKYRDAIDNLVASREDIVNANPELIPTMDKMIALQNQINHEAASMEEFAAKVSALDKTSTDYIHDVTKLQASHDAHKAKWDALSTELNAVESKMKTLIEPVNNSKTAAVVKALPAAITKMLPQKMDLRHIKSKLAELESVSPAFNKSIFKTDTAIPKETNDKFLAYYNLLIGKIGMALGAMQAGNTVDAAALKSEFNNKSMNDALTDIGNYINLDDVDTKLGDATYNVLNRMNGITVDPKSKPEPVEINDGVIDSELQKIAKQYDEEIKKLTSAIDTTSTEINDLYAKLGETSKGDAVAALLTIFNNKKKEEYSSDLFDADVDAFAKAAVIPVDVAKYFKLKDSAVAGDIKKARSEFEKTKAILAEIESHLDDTKKTDIKKTEDNKYAFVNLFDPASDLGTISFASYDITKDDGTKAELIHKPTVYNACMKLPDMIKQYETALKSIGMVPKEAIGSQGLRIVDVSDKEATELPQYLISKIHVFGNRSDDTITFDIVMTYTEQAKKLKKTSMVDVIPIELPDVGVKISTKNGVPEEDTIIGTKAAELKADIDLLSKISAEMERNSPDMITVMKNAAEYAKLHNIKTKEVTDNFASILDAAKSAYNKVKTKSPVDNSHADAARKQDNENFTRAKQLALNALEDKRNETNIDELKKALEIKYPTAPWATKFGKLDKKIQDKYSNIENVKEYLEKKIKELK